MQREMRRRGGGFGFDEDRVRVFDAAGRVVRQRPAPDVRGERAFAVRVVAVNEEVVSARDIAARVADEAREPSPARHLTWWPGRGLGAVGRRRRRRGGSHARGLFHRLASAAVNSEPLGGDRWVRAEYAEGQPWTRDPRGPRVQDCSPRIPHGKVTKWQSIRISPCQGVMIGR